MGNDGAENTSDVSSDEGDLNVSATERGREGIGYLSLDEFSVFVFLFGEFGVDIFDDSFEGGEFHHGIGDLSSPEGLQSLVQSTISRHPQNSRCGEGSRDIPSDTFSRSNLIPSFKCSTRERRNGRLHSNFDSFPRTQEHIGEEFSRGRGSQVKCRSIFMGSFLTDDIRVFLLEEFVETVFSSSLEGVSDECWAPTCEISF
jgi:hypothetical protein